MILYFLEPEAILPSTLASFFPLYLCTSTVLRPPVPLSPHPSRCSPASLLDRSP
ncbi:hypothetical protein C8Q76DRAFT_754007 [Earliella scabrosa]|nr:hypothetical protein C8Q76DRAFT_754007 [Earliella scabrosa]